MDCKQFVTLMQAILDGEATSAEEAQFRMHQNKCKHCAIQFDMEDAYMQVIRMNLKKECCPEEVAASIRNSVLNSDPDA